MLIVNRELVVDRAPDDVWEFVKDMRNWAVQMPGYISHEQISGDDSVWTLQVNLGPFTRPIVMDVHVTRWVCPNEVTFELKGRSDPFVGSGAFRSRPAGKATSITLEFQATPTGSMAKVLSAMATPVLQEVASRFSDNLGEALGGACGPVNSTDRSKTEGVWARWARRLAHLFHVRRKA
ncbi:CoxG family protein [Paraburkholderia xenovorans]|jgi:carbon monoxide dehydrogenase subunit G